MPVTGFSGGVPIMDFSELGNLPRVYQQEQNEQTLANLGKGLANGSIDYRQAAGLAAQAGKPELSLSLLKLGETKQQQEDFLSNYKTLFGGAGQPSSQPASQSMPQPAPAAAPTFVPPAATNESGIVAPPRAPVQSSPKVWGDDEAVKAGLYESPTAKPAPVAQAPVQPAQPTPSVRPNPVGSNDAQIAKLMFVLAHPGATPGAKEAAKIALTEAIKTPDNLREYDLYRQQTLASGGQPIPYLDFAIKLKQAGATAITNDMRGENAEAKALGEGAGKRANETMAAASAAPSKIQNLNRMSVMLDQVQQGKIEPARMTVSAWAKSMGLNDDVAVRLGLDPKGVGTAQAVQALSNEMTLGHIGPGGLPANNFSNTDRQFITEIVPKLGDDPESNRIKIEAARRMANLDLERGRAWQQFHRDPANKGKSFADFEIDWAEKTAKRDLFGDLIKKVPQQQQAAAAPANMPAGAKQAPDGNYYVPDPARPGKYLMVQ